MSPILTDGLRSVGRAWPVGEKPQFGEKRKAESDDGHKTFAAIAYANVSPAARNGAGLAVL
jgi:hypothetical protein